MQKDITVGEQPSGKENIREENPGEVAGQDQSGAVADAAYEEYRTCENCNARLYGSFCSSCGQKDVNFLRPVWMLLEDALADLFSFDSRFYRTLRPLMIHPGYITAEYLKGRRARFVPPFRQYLFISILFFLALVTSDIRLFETAPINYDPMSNEDVVVDQQPGDEQSAASTPKEGELSGNVVHPSELSEEEQGELQKSIIEATANDADEAFWKEQVSRLIKGWNRISEDPTLMNKLMADWIPRVMFLLLPVYAFIFKITYIFRKHYYFEHLVFSLHAHAFVFLLFTVMVLLYQYAPITRPHLSWLFLYIPIYLLIAMKKVYAQGWFKTVIKACFIAFVYFMLLVSSIIPVIGYGITQI